MVRWTTGWGYRCLGTFAVLCFCWVAAGKLAADESGSDAAISVNDACHCEFCGSGQRRSNRCPRCRSLRDQIADQGITFSSNLTQFYFGNVSGGLNQTDRYAGHGDYLANVDFGKLGVQQGLFLKVRAEHRFGSSIAPATGSILPPTLATELPVADSRDLYLTNVLFTQMFSESFGVYAGKLDTLDGDQNAYASGRGITQFSNTAFVATPIALRAIPYSSLGCGMVFLDGGEPLLNFLVMNPTNTANESGFDELFNDGVVLSTELRFKTALFGMPGHQLFCGTWSSRDYVALDQDPRILLPQVAINRTSGTWALNWNTDQALWVNSCNPKQHWGYFARAGLADAESNPVQYFLSAGLGGSSPLRAGDGFGVGYYHLGTSEELVPTIQAVLGPFGDAQGVEVFYRAQLTPMISLTPDFQWIDPARRNVEESYLLGARLNMTF